MYEFIELLAALICPRLKFLALLAYGRMFSVLIFKSITQKINLITVVLFKTTAVFEKSMGFLNALEKSTSAANV